MIPVHWFPRHIFSVLVQRAFSCRTLSFLQEETKQRSKPKSWLERFKNDTPLRLGKILLYPSLQSRDKKRETHFDPKRDTAAAVHQSSVEPTSRWSLQNSKPMSPSTLLTFFLAFRRLPRLLTGSWNILPTWVEKDKHNGLSTAPRRVPQTVGVGRFLVTVQEEVISA